MRVLRRGPYYDTICVQYGTRDSLIFVICSGGGQVTRYTSVVFGQCLLILSPPYRRGIDVWDKSFARGAPQSVASENILGAGQSGSQVKGSVYDTQSHNLHRKGNG